MYSLIEAETIQRRREFSYIPLTPTRIVAGHQTSKNSKRVFSTPTFRRQSKEPPILGWRPRMHRKSKKSPNQNATKRDVLQIIKNML
jgi:hypothetical protein